MMCLKYSVSLLLVICCYCTNDQGILSPADQNSMTPLAHFQGYAVNDGDTAISAARLLKIKNPKIGVLWQFMAFTQFISDLSISTAETKLPFTFSGSLCQPPPSQVYNSNEVAVGIMILYSDADNNGRFDRGIHPSLQKDWVYLDSLRNAFDSLRNELTKISTILPEPVYYKDTFYITYDNSIIQHSSGLTDSFKLTIPPENYILRRVDILRNDRKWDDFFVYRKREQPISFSYHPQSGYSRCSEVSYMRRLFPSTGNNLEFDRLSKECSIARYFLGFESDRIIITAYINKWLSYPYNGFNEPGQDWIAGRAKLHFIFYFPDQKSIQELLDAEKYSSFSINHKERIKPGYNLMIADDQYRCDILPWSDSIIIQLGMYDLYTNTSEPLENPVKEIIPVTIDKKYIEYAEGSYAYMPFNPLMLHGYNSTLWARIPQIGICKLEAADSLHYYSNADNVQVEIVRFNGVTEKALVYRNGERFVGTVSKPDSSFGKFRNTVVYLASREPVSLNDSILKSYAASYDYGTDSVQIAVSDDHLDIRIPGKGSESFYPLNDSLFFTKSGDQLIQFRRNDSGQTYELQLIRGTVSLTAPSRIYHSRNASEISGIAPVSMNTIIDTNGGSGTDLLCTQTGTCRYIPPSDARFLQKGDGALVNFVQGAHNDLITFFSPDDFMVFQLSNLLGKTVGFELYIKGQKDLKPNSQVRLYCTGGTSINTCNDKLIDNQYYPLKSDSVTNVSINPVVVKSNPYFIKIGYTGTAVATPVFAVDSYRIGTE